MFEIGFTEIILVMIVGLIVLGPERLPVAVKTVAGWIRAMRSLASSVQNELTQELKLQELQDSIKKVEKSALQDLSPELKASMDELRAAAQAMQKSYKEPASAETKPAEESNDSGSHNESQSQPTVEDTQKAELLDDNNSTSDSDEPEKVVELVDNTSQSVGGNR